MMVRVYEAGNNGVVVVRPATDSRAGDETLEDWHARVMARTEARIPELAGRAYLDIDEADLPAADSRDAWMLVDGQVVVDADKLADIEARRSAPSQGEQLAAALDAATVAHPEFADLFGTLGAILTGQRP